MALNPYAAFLNGDDPIAIISTTSARLQDLAARLPPEQVLLRPPQTPWNAREIIAHLADNEISFSFRLRQTLAVDHPTSEPYNQDRWAARYANRDLESSLALFAAARRVNLLLIESTTPLDRQRKMTHPERGTMTLWTIVETMAGHDINHLRQLERLAAPSIL